MNNELATDMALQPIEHDGQRVLTTAQLAEAYGTSKETIRQNFKRNKSRYVEGKHFYCLAGEALKGFKGNVTNCHVVPETIHQLTLWTERGALLHAKSLNTDKAWEVYDYLVESYFRVRELSASAQLLTMQDAAEIRGMLETVQLQLQKIVSIRDTISYLDRLEIRDWAMDRAESFFDTPAPHDNEAAMVVSAIYEYLRNYFQIDSYRSLKKDQMAEAERLILQWRPDPELLYRIYQANTRSRLQQP